MNKIAACALTLALLSACSDDAAVADGGEGADQPAITRAPDTMESYLGSWAVAYADGSTGVLTNDADGSFTLVRGGSEIVGLWSFGAEQSCWQEEEAEEAACYTVGAAGEGGARVLEREDGTSMTITPIEPQAVQDN